jgi:SAM-dependent methyltransferase
MENSGCLHEKLLKRYGTNYSYSAYFGKDIESGTMINGVLHEDVRHTSFPSEYFDFILSGDVLEHVSNPEDAFTEIHRILKPGGKLVFTIPFLEDQEKSDRRAMEDADGEFILLKEPQYHSDPLRSDGILVFTLFGWDVMEMARNAGLQCRVRKLYMIRHGIIGPGSVVFLAEKPMTDIGKPVSIQSIHS